MDNSKKFLKELVRLRGKTKKYRYITFAITIIMSLFDTVIAFAIPFATENFKNGYHNLAITLLILSVLDQLISSIIRSFDNNFDMKYRMYYEVESIEKSMDILNLVKDKVYITENKIRRRLSTVEIKENTGEYITKTRKFEDDLIDGIMKILMFISMFTGTITTTMLSVKNIPLLITIMTICIISIVFITIRQIKRREFFFKKRREYNNKLNIQKMDILNVTPLNNKHTNFLTTNFINFSREILKEAGKISVIEDIEGCYKSAVMSISTILLLGFVIFSSEDLDIGTFASLIALASLYGSMLRSLRSQIESIQRLINSASDKKSYNEIMNIIIEKYLELKNLENKDLEKINQIDITNLNFAHEDIDNNVVHRIMAKDLKFESGESILIYGKSGSGKSTLLKILSGVYNNMENNICINTKLYKNSIYNYIIYDPDSSLGCKDILSEITFTNNKSDVEVKKLIDILKGIRIYESIICKAKNEPIVDYLSSVFKDSFSEGERQRIILVRMLYNLDKSIDVVILDEPAANLDNITASMAIEYMTKYCNNDRSRIVVIVSHQVEIIKEFCNKLYNFNQIDENTFEIQES